MPKLSKNVIIWFFIWVKSHGLLLRNELNFWNVHGIMNTSGLLQSK